MPVAIHIKGNNSSDNVNLEMSGCLSMEIASATLVL